MYEELGLSREFSEQQILNDALKTDVKPWARQLEELRQLQDTEAGEEPDGAKRLIWQINWSANISGIVKYLSITPLEQTLRKKGWSKGRKVSLKRLYNNTDEFPCMTNQDMEVADTIWESDFYRGSNYNFDLLRAMNALVGHPLVFKEVDGTKVEITADAPVFMVERARDNGYLLKSYPYPGEYPGPRLIIVEDSVQSLRVVRFKGRESLIARTLGFDGLKLPPEAKDALMDTLEELASAVTIHSEHEDILDKLNVNIDVLEPDERIYARLELDRHSLNAEFFVRPLGPEGMALPPATGASKIFATIDGRRAMVRRDLEHEKTLFEEFKDACPALKEAKEDPANYWKLTKVELALEFLSQLAELDDRVTVEWPVGHKAQVTRNCSSDSMNLSIRSAKDWFALSGELKVSEQTILSVKSLLEKVPQAVGRFIPLEKGEYLALSKELIRKLKILQGLGELKGDDLRLPSASAVVVEDLLEGTGSVNTDAGWMDRVKTLKESMELEIKLPETFRGELRGYQFEGYQWLMRLAHWGAGACLADDMGLGKTIQTLAMLLDRAESGPALVVAPTSVCLNWAAEASRFAPSLNVIDLRSGDREELISNLKAGDLMLSSYGLLHSEIDKLCTVKWSTVILDEAQAIKNRGAKRSLSAMRLKADFRVATTGTPIENRLSELWNIFRFLNPQYLGSYESFRGRFIVPIEKENSDSARDTLKRMIQPFILRRTKAQVLKELPPKTEMVLRIDMNDEERAFYEAIRRSAVERLAESSGEDDRFQVFAELMKLRRACCNVALVTKERNTEYPSAKLDAFAEILDELRSGGHRALVFSQFVDHLAILRNYLDDSGIEYCYLDGSTPPRAREANVKAFQDGKGDCFLISLKAGGTGLNLTAADYVIHMDPWWNPAVEDQASDRAHRIGQEQPVTIYRIVAKDTIEEKIVDLHAHKRNLAESLLEGMEQSSRLTLDAMLELIRG